jgi:hypothetical protein
MSNKNLQFSNPAIELIYEVKMLDNLLIPNKRKGIVIPSSNEEKKNYLII